MNRFRKNEKGFTLVELLIVVAIIGILAAIAIPQFVKYKKNAAESACESDLRNCMNEAAAQYANGSWPTDGSGRACDDMLPGNNIELTMTFDTEEYELSAQTDVIYNGIKTKPGFDEDNGINGTWANCTVVP